MAQTCTSGRFRRPPRRGDPMRVRRPIAPWTVLTGVVLLGWIAADAQVRRVDDAALKSAGRTGDEWLAYGLSPAESRFSPLNQIGTANVKRLAPAWSYEIGAGGGGQEGTPLVWN